MNKFIAGGCLLLSVLTLSCTSGIREKGEIGKTASVEQSAFSQEQVKLYTPKDSSLPMRINISWLISKILKMRKAPRFIMRS